MADLELESLGNGDGNNYLLRDNSKIPLTGTNALAGSIVPSANDTYDLGSSSKAFNIVYAYGIRLQAIADIRTKTNTGHIEIYGGNGWHQGSALFLRGKNEQNLPGYFQLLAFDDTAETVFQGTPNGALTWGSKNIAMQEDVVPRSGGAVLSGNRFSRDVDNESLEFMSGPLYYSGAYLALNGKNCPTDPGQIFLVCRKSDGGAMPMNLYPSGTWTWTGTACQIISDQRYKQQIAEIDDKLLDAWEDVDLVQFKYNDAVDQKGDNARLHTGFVVQQIDSACKSHGVDVSKYGLYCHEEYPEETEEVEVENEDGTKTKETKVIREASEHYSLRYTETLVVECAYLRRENNRLKERLSKIENLLNI